MIKKLDPERVTPILKAALKEDIGNRDLTSQALLGPNVRVGAEIVARGTGVVAGVPLVEMACQITNRSLRVKPMVADGTAVKSGKAVVFLEGQARSILMGERTLINFLSHLSGIASLTRAFVEKTKPYPAKILDTRKTTPNLRYLEKYAVAVGGGRNHRMGLYDQVMVKENHLQALLLQNAKGPGRGHKEMIPAVLSRVRSAVPKKTIVEVEVRTPEEFEQALAHGAEIILLDHFSAAQVRQAVKRRLKSKRRVFLEASGGITLANVASYAATGVDYISTGALVRDAKGLDFSLEIV